MQKPFTANPQPQIFYSANEQIISAIQEDSICLHANAFINSQHTQ